MNKIEQKPKSFCANLPESSDWFELDDDGSVYAEAGIYSNSLCSALIIEIKKNKTFNKDKLNKEFEDGIKLLKNYNAAQASVLFRK